ncbi:OLC1v1038721C1 [Oldenlandia corymbosa var. corymbosa]|uniref:OLC1v1038721C1 n=1 Tax=Oldenlandia corymbosa var. corymbosa TaxID=529605 RepID=A0AAV1D206_OLDCO|nr:OLC1v1038721C1 [Oldenlandia corymbosa var. corymbosa]
MNTAFGQPAELGPNTNSNSNNGSFFGARFYGDAASTGNPSGFQRPANMGFGSFSGQNLNPGSTYGQSNNPFSIPSGKSGFRITAPSPSSSSSSTFGPQNGSVWGSLKPGPSTSSMHQGTGRGSFVPIPCEGCAGGQLHSVSAMPNLSKSHEELRFDDYQLAVGKGSTSTDPLGRFIPNNMSQTSNAVATGFRPFGSISSTTPSFFSFSQCQPQTSSAPSTGPGIWGNFPSSSSGFTFQSQTHGSSTMSTATRPQFSFPPSTLSPFTSPSQPQASSTVSTGTWGWVNFPSSSSGFTFQSQPHTSSTMSAATGAQFSSPQSTLSPFTSQSQSQASSTVSAGTGPMGDISFEPAPPFSFHIQPLVSNAMSAGKGTMGDFSFEPTSPFCFHTQPQVSTAMSTVTRPQQQQPSSSSAPPVDNAAPQNTQTTTATQTKPVHNAASQTTQTTHALDSKFFKQPTAGTLKAETDTPIATMQQSDQITIAITPSAVESPFGMQSTVQISVNFLVSQLQHGISSISFSENPSSTKRVVMNLGQTGISFEIDPPKSDGQKKAPVYEEKSSGTGIGKSSTPSIPMQKPRAWTLNLTEEGAPETKSSQSPLQDENSSKVENGNSDYSDSRKPGSGSSAESKLNVEVTCNSTAENEKCDVVTRNKTDRDLTPNEDAAGIEAMMPKMQSFDHFTIPPIQELAEKERIEPGFCGHVKDFVVGRKGYGSIKFLGETDVRNLDLESLIKFNHQEVIVYADESKRPQVGQGLNKPAEITLLDVKCIDNAGNQYVGGPKVENFKKVLIKKAAEQGVEFVSYDPVNGEWKFRVQHF